MRTIIPTMGVDMIQLREMRERAGMQQQDAAKALGVSAQSLSYWENGKRNINLADAVKLADLYKCSLDELAGRDWPHDNTVRIAPDEQLVIDAMAKLNRDGRARVVEDAAIMVESGRYEKSSQDESAGVQGA